MKVIGRKSKAQAKMRKKPTQLENREQAGVTGMRAGEAATARPCRAFPTLVRKYCLYPASSEKT